MKVLVIGSGGREHALAWKIKQSRRVRQVYCAPGNGGTDAVALNVPIKADDLQGLLAFARKEKIDLTVVGPEVALTMGIVDLFEKEGLAIFGPRQNGAILEASKVWTKDFLREERIPTAHYEAFQDFEKAVDFLKTQAYPI
ncbi:MAG: phosphoribosylamine--glycine ligase, partial [Deltaproteobacteria bacterium]|nr:phosphoribosylamine--glycine ligase [Deltaproteobacteria bacterium]